MNEEEKSILPPESKGNGEEKAEEICDGESLLAENRWLSEELARLKREYSESEAKQKGLLKLEELAGITKNGLYAAAVRRAEEDETLKALPYEKRYEMSYLILLGEEERKNGRYGRTPPFARSTGMGDAPAMSEKAPTTFEMARENARKYFGGK